MEWNGIRNGEAMEMAIEENLANVCSHTNGFIGDAIIIVLAFIPYYENQREYYGYDGHGILRTPRYVYCSFSADDRMQAAECKESCGRTSDR